MSGASGNAHDGAPLPPEPWRMPSTLAPERSSKRLTLRFWRPEDAPALYDAVNVDRTALLRYLPWAETANRSVEDCAETIHRMGANRARTDPPADDFTVGIVERSTGRALGGTGLHRMVLAAYEAEIGYWIRPDRWGEGLCTEAVQLLVDWAFEPQAQGGWGLRRLHIRCAESNLASRKVAEHVGAAREATFRLDRWVRGLGWDSTCVYGLVNEAWKAPG